MSEKVSKRNTEIEDLRKRIEEFLKTPVKSESGSIAVATTEDVFELQFIIDSLIKYKFEGSRDEVLPVESILVNRLEEETITYSAVPHKGVSRHMILLNNLTKAGDAAREVLEKEKALEQPNDEKVKQLEQVMNALEVLPSIKQAELMSVINKKKS